MRFIDILAATEKIPTSDTPGLPDLSPIDVLAGVLNGAYALAAVAAVIVIILSGFTFATGSYDPAKITKAKNTILYAVVGLIAIMAAFALTQFIIERMR